jgi:glycerol-3-phosphate dehydrogenase
MDCKLRDLIIIGGGIVGVGLCHATFSASGDEKEVVGN